MISVYKNQEKIIVTCSTSEYITIQKIKEVVKTIKKIDKSNNLPCSIIIKSVEKINFTLKGELFFNRIIKSRLFINSRISISYQ